MLLTARPPSRIREILLVIQAGDNAVTGLAAEVLATPIRKHRDLMLLEGDIRSEQTYFCTVAEQLRVRVDR